jgi:hypothetical protein
LKVEAIKKRIDELTAVAKQTEINLHALGGAIQDCNYWLTQLEAQNALNSVNDTQSNESQHQG